MTGVNSSRLSCSDVRVPDKLFSKVKNPRCNFYRLQDHGRPASPTEQINYSLAPRVGGARARTWILYTLSMTDSVTQIADESDSLCRLI